MFIAVTVAFGLLVGSFFRTRERAFQYIVATSIPLFFLANLSWPAVMTPQPLVWLAQLLPTTSGINLMVRLNQMDARLTDVSHELITLTLLLLLYGSLAARRLRPEKETEGIKSQATSSRAAAWPLRADAQGSGAYQNGMRNARRRPPRARRLWHSTPVLGHGVRARGRG